jgi:hypothetical protein
MLLRAAARRCRFAPSCRLHAAAACRASASAAAPPPPPPPPEAPQHWLDAHFPGARESIDARAHAAWLDGLRALLRDTHATCGREEELVADVQRRYSALLQRHAARRLSGSSSSGGEGCAARGETALEAGHARAAARVGAAAAALSPYIRDAGALRALLRALGGARSAPLTRAALAASLLFAPRPAALAAAALAALRHDYGFAEDASPAHAEDASAARLVVTRCPYVSFFDAEADTLPPGLAAATCCSLDAAVWFDLLGGSDAAEEQGSGGGSVAFAVLRALRPRAAAVRVELASSMARGDAACCLRVVDERGA